MIITLDGPAGVGKSSVTRALAESLGLTYIDTGAMYRGVALAARERGVDWNDEEALAAMLPSIALSFCRVDGVDHLLLNDRDVEALIRTPAISQGASAVARHSAVRHFLVEQQRELGCASPSILEGRDTGTVVFPDADCKFFLEASPEVRARRRWLQLREQGDTSTTMEELKAQIEARDRQDSERALSPLRCADDAVRVDTSERSLDEVIAVLLATVRARMGLPSDATTDALRDG